MSLQYLYHESSIRSSIVSPLRLLSRDNLHPLRLWFWESLRKFINRHLSGPSAQSIPHILNHRMLLRRGILVYPQAFILGHCSDPPSWTTPSGPLSWVSPGSFFLGPHPRETSHPLYLWTSFKFSTGIPWAFHHGICLGPFYYRIPFRHPILLVYLSWRSYIFSL